MIDPDDVSRMYDYINGRLYWKAGRILAGKEVGWDSSHGYRRCNFMGRSVLVHRLIWILHYGYVPEYIDHIDGDRKNNKIENLRPATSSQNQMNSSARSHNKSGFKNVFWSKSANKWRVVVRKNHEITHGGYFSNLGKASEVAEQLRNSLHQEYACHEAKRNRKGTDYGSKNERTP